MNMGSKSNGLDVSEWSRAPPSGPMWQRMLKAIYNPEDKSFLGRTPKRWGIVFTFYLVFYAGLAVLFAVCMAGLLLTLDRAKPTYTMQRSLIGMNPGVAARPRPVDRNKGPFMSESVLLRYNRDDPEDVDPYPEQLKEFFQPTGNESWSTEKECSMNDNYGFPDTPCFFIKLNKIIDWKPDFYEEGSLPADMPEDLADHIRGLEPSERKQVWVSCWEEEGNATGLEYPWGRGLPARFYPYRNDDGYRSPVVAVKLVPLANKLITVRCRAWAKNIDYNKSMKYPSGYTRFQLYIVDHTRGNGDELTN